MLQLKTSWYAFLTHDSALIACVKYMARKMNTHSHLRRNLIFTVDLLAWLNQESPSYRGRPTKASRMRILALCSAIRDATSLLSAAVEVQPRRGITGRTHRQRFGNPSKRLKKCCVITQFGPPLKLMGSMALEVCTLTMEVDPVDHKANSLRPGRWWNWPRPNSCI